MVKRELYVSYGFSAVRRQQQRQQEVLSSSCPNISTSFICLFRWRRRRHYYRFLDGLRCWSFGFLLRLCKYISTSSHFKTTSTSTKPSQKCQPLLPSLPLTRLPRFAPSFRKVKRGTIADRLVILQKELESFLEQEYVSFNCR